MYPYLDQIWRMVDKAVLHTFYKFIHMHNKFVPITAVISNSKLILSIHRSFCEGFGFTKNFFSFLFGQVYVGTRES